MTSAGDAKKQILIIEDEPDLVRGLADALGFEGFDVQAASTAQEGIDRARELSPDCVLLDLMLPDDNGYKVCETLRSLDPVLPIIMLTAKAQEADKVRGLDVGADDYVTKPFSVRELMLRIKAIIRRAKPEPSSSQVIEFGSLRLDRDAHRVWIDGEEVVLTALEFKLLAAFVSRKGRVQSRDSLLSDVWGIDAEVTTRTVDTHVKRLREKLGDLGRYIETLRGVGYRFRDQPDEL